MNSLPLSIKAPTKNINTQSTITLPRTIENNDVINYVKKIPITQIPMLNGNNTEMIQLISKEDADKLSKVASKVIIQTPKLLNCIKENGYTICSHYSNKNLKDEYSKDFTLIKTKDGSFYGLFGSH